MISPVKQQTNTFYEEAGFNMFDTGILILRVVAGLLFAAHGTQKLFGWFGGYGIKGTAGWLESLGAKPGVLMAVLAGLSELLGGLLLALGLWVWIAAALIIIPMLVAIAKVHGANGIWATSNGYEYNLVLIAIALAVAFTGAGAYSIDAILS
ncbi:Putative oxidoreductase MhqP [Paenibacillus sp. P22]|nr:Putative oxidoreductase MhqP [Paenibacillus sp. P22]